MNLPTVLRSGSHSISPTAHYTGYVWARHAFGPPELATPAGHVMFHALRPLMAAGRALGPGSLEDVLLARHRLIDAHLTSAIETGRVSQVVEIAAGMSPRGLRYARMHGDRITYIEADLPGMARRKRSALASMDALGPHHRVVDIDALSEVGPQSLASVMSDLDATKGVAIITEGLLNYLSRADVEGLWARIAEAIGTFDAGGVYLSDLHLASENDGAVERLAMALVAPFVRGRIHLHFADAVEATQALQTAGFDTVALHRPPGFPGVRVVEALIAGR